MNPWNDRSPQFVAAYRDSDRALRVRHAKIGCILTLVLMPAGTSLDYFVYPDYLWDILPARWLCDLVLLPLFLLLFTQAGRRHIQIIGSAWIAVAAATIAWMVFRTEGIASPYYAGLNLVIIVGCLLMPFTFREAVAVCGAVIALYVAACLLHPGPPPPNGSSVAFSNLYFMAITSIIAVASCHYYNVRRIEDFELRYELDQKNQQVNESYRKLSELDRLRSEFFANISHELRTPLTLIIGPLDELWRQADGLSEAAARSVDLARQNSLRLLKLINDLLEIVRLEEGSNTPSFQDVDLSVFMPAMTESMGYLSETKEIELTCKSHGQPLWVRGDPSQLEKVLVNLLSNALKFTPRGGSIRVRCDTQDGREAVVEVHDTGIGIPAKDLPYIFDRFRQVDGSPTRQFQGIGLGLSLARELIDQHGGSLTAESEPGKGSCFRFTLPIVDPVPLPLASGANDAAPSLPATPDPLAEIYRQAERSRSLMPIEHWGDEMELGHGEMRVLVVDDEPDMRRYLVSSLSQNYRVLQARDGQAGYEIAQAERPDVILLDLMLPRMSGLEVCERLKRDPQTRKTKIIVLTARHDEASKVRALQIGADDFLHKPFSTLEILARVRNLLAVGRLQRDLESRNDELERAIRDLRNTEAQLIQSEKMNALGVLSAGLLHEINNPLNYTLAAVDIALAEARNPERLDTLHDIREGMNRIRDIVTDLGIFAYPARQGEHVSFTIRDAFKTASRLAGAKLDGVDIECELDEADIWGSKTQIVHLLINLLVNASRAARQAEADESPRRRPQIRVDSRCLEARLRVRVFDNGHGIDPDHLPKIFDPFFTTQDVGQGMGLGLSICHTIVKNHGGEITVQSELGRWTRFTFDLPLAQEGVLFGA